jgi:hypothetical protein
MYQLCSGMISLSKGLFFVRSFVFHFTVEFTIEQATKAQKGSRGIAVLFL